VDAAEGAVTEKNQDNLDKEYWKDKTCYKCEKKGHPENKCPKKLNNDDDEKTVVSAAIAFSNGCRSPVRASG
jgi:hypothetical protein